MRECNVCGTLNEDTDTECKICGTELVRKQAPKRVVVPKKEVNGKVNETTKRVNADKGQPESVKKPAQIKQVPKKAAQQLNDAEIDLRDNNEDKGKTAEYKFSRPIVPDKVTEKVNNQESKKETKKVDKSKEDKKFTETTEYEIVTIKDWIKTFVIMLIPLINIVWLLKLILYKGADKGKITLRNYAIATVIIAAASIVIGLVASEMLSEVVKNIIISNY